LSPSPLTLTRPVAAKSPRFVKSIVAHPIVSSLTFFTCSALQTFCGFQTWRGMARLQAGIVWKGGWQQFFGIFQTHKAGLCGNERHISSQSAKAEQQLSRLLGLWAKLDDFSEFGLSHRA